MYNDEYDEKIQLKIESLQDDNDRLSGLLEKASESENITFDSLNEMNIEIENLKEANFRLKENVAIQKNFCEDLETKIHEINCESESFKNQSEQKNKTIAGGK